MAAAVGAITAAFLLPVSFLGVVVGLSDVRRGAADLLSSSPSPFAQVSLELGVWMLFGGFGGAIGFAGFVACALLPPQLLGRNRWARRLTVSALSLGIISALAVVLIPLLWGYRSFDPTQVVLLSLAFLGYGLVHDVTANPSIKRTA